MDKVQTEGHMCPAFSWGGNAQVQAFQKCKEIIGRVIWPIFILGGIKGGDNTTC